MGSSSQKIDSLAKPASADLKSERLLSHTVILASSEVALGSIVHGFKIPFGGHFLSLNQGLILGFAIRGLKSRRDAIRTVHEISLTSAALKALSPMGNRLGPMLAISMQGVLYSLGVLLLGVSVLGMLLGMTLLALWGVFQPLAVAWIIFGKPFFDGLLKLWNEISALFGISESVLWPVLLAFLGAKVFLGWIVAWISWRGGETLERRYLERLQSAVNKSGLTAIGAKKEDENRSTFQQVIRDLLNPWFLGGIAVSIGFFIGTGEHGAPEIALYGLRIFGVAMLLFWAVRAVRRSWLERIFGRFPGLLARVDQVRKLFPPQ